MIVFTKNLKKISNYPIAIQICFSCLFYEIKSSMGTKNNIKVGEEMIFKKNEIRKAEMMCI